MIEESGAFSEEAPVVQFTEPVTAPEIWFRTQVLVGVVPVFGTASGAPKKHPVSVQLRSLPVSADVAPATVAVLVAWSHEAILLTALPMSGTTDGSGTAFCPPPK